MKRGRGRILALLLGLALLGAACGAPGRETPGEPAEELIVVGMCQVGAESDWRVANSESMKAVFTEENGYRLLFEDARQKQENQITAIRKFIQQQVDYIVLMPIQESGWHSVLQEAKERDYRDSHREIAPLRQAEDAALLDTTELDEQESEAALLRLIRERVGQ